MSSPRAVWQAFDRAAATYEQASPLQASVAARLLAQVGERVQPGQVWMDAGCGTGRLARALAARGARVWAIDQAPAMLDGLDRVDGIEPLCLDLADLPLPEGMLDGWVSSFALHWLGPEVLPALLRLLRPGGEAHVAVPVQGSLAALQARCPGVPVMQFHPAADWLAQSGVVQAEQFAIHQPYANLRSLWQDLRQMGGAQLGAAPPRPTVSVAQWRQWWRDPEPIALDYQVLLLRLQREQAASDLWSRLAARG